ncbi:MAG TPA: crotonase/enoyl-CoA hydratase family protein [Aliiroseovarius sp.]|nr:crotonase/enoyl-CoA hydratase family protein [Aliiroseovarius sp.]
MSQTVLFSQEGPVATLTLNRPEKLNALSLRLIEDLVAAAERLRHETHIRAVILTGSGDSFCAGLDISAMPKLLEFVQKGDGIMGRTHGDANLFQAVSTLWAELPMPVIAAVKGHVFGGGFQIMLGADMRIACPQTQFSIMESKWGLVPDMGGMVAMRHLARGDIIRRLTYTAEVFAANDALEWGFVTELAADPLARATDLARHIAARSPDAIRAAKALIRDSESMSRADILLAESRAQQALIGTPNQMEAVMAGFEKRTPKFRD